MPACAQQAPLDGALTIVVGYPPGGSSDRIARLVADRLKDRLGVTVVVENKTGAGGRIAAQGLHALGTLQRLNNYFGGRQYREVFEENQALINELKKILSR